MAEWRSGRASSVPGPAGGLLGLLLRGGLLGLLLRSGLPVELLGPVDEAVAASTGALRVDQRSELGQLVAAALLAIPAHSAKELDEGAVMAELAGHEQVDAFAIDGAEVEASGVAGLDHHGGAGLHLPVGLSVEPGQAVAGLDQLGEGGDAGPSRALEGVPR